MRRGLLIVSILLFAVSPFGAAITPAFAQGGSRYFPETQHNLQGGFLEYWNNHGGLAQQGYPLSEEFSEVAIVNGSAINLTVQYFERAVFEYHPSNDPAYRILLARLGAQTYQDRYPNGATGQVANQNNGRFFSETGHWVGGSFLQYWDSHGGLAQQGYPLTDEFSEVALDGKTYTVQYFERAVFEYHPENAPPNDVLLSQLGKQRLNSKYPGGNSATAPTQPMASTPAQPNQATIPSEPSEFAKYIADKHSKLGSVQMKFSDIHGSYFDNGTAYIVLNVDTSTFTKLVADASEDDAALWGELVWADAKIAYPKHEAIISLSWATYSDDICTRNCVTTCYYQSDSYTSGRGWYTSYTIVEVDQNPLGGVQKCGRLDR